MTTQREAVGIDRIILNVTDLGREWQLEQSQQNTRAVLEVAACLETAGGTADAIRLPLEALRTAFGWDYGVYWQFERKRGVLAAVLECGAIAAVARDVITGRTLRPGEGPVGKCLESREVTCEALRSGSETPAPFGSLVALPVVIHGNPAGVLCFYAELERIPDATRIELLGRIAALVSARAGHLQKVARESELAAAARALREISEAAAPERPAGDGLRQLVAQSAAALGWDGAALWLSSGSGPSASLEPAFATEAPPTSPKLEAAARRCRESMRADWIENPVPGAGGALVSPLVSGDKCAGAIAWLSNAAQEPTRIWKDATASAVRILSSALARSQSAAEAAASRQRAVELARLTAAVSLEAFERAASELTFCRTVRYLEASAAGELRAIWQRGTFSPARSQDWSASLLLRVLNGETTVVESAGQTLTVASHAAAPGRPEGILVMEFPAGALANGAREFCAAAAAVLGSLRERAALTSRLEEQAREAARLAAQQEELRRIVAAAVQREAEREPVPLRAMAAQLGGALDSIGTSARHAEAALEQGIELTAQGVRAANALPGLFAPVLSLAGESAEGARQVSALAAQTRKHLEGIEASMGKLGRTGSTLAPAAASLESLAKQTHFLSLSASIEANRTGAGRTAFAAIAGEVKDLAAKVARAASSITEGLTAMREAEESGSGQAAQAARQAEALCGQAAAAAREAAAVTQELAALRTRVDSTARDAVKPAARLEAAREHLARSGPGAARASEIARQMEALGGRDVVPV